jgi:tetratricopeptide (TPR) repeat protein
LRCFLILILLVFFLNSPAVAILEATVQNQEELYKKASAMLDDYNGTVAQLYQAAGYLQKILEANPDYALAYVGLARVEYKLGYINYDNYKKENLGQAHKYLSKALLLDPELFEAYIARGYVYLFQKDLKDARNMAEAAVKLKPPIKKKNTTKR